MVSLRLAVIAALFVGSCAMQLDGQTSDAKGHRNGETPKNHHHAHHQVDHRGHHQAEKHGHKGHDLHSEPRKVMRMENHGKAGSHQASEHHHKHHHKLVGPPGASLSQDASGPDQKK